MDQEAGRQVGGEADRTVDDNLLFLSVVRGGVPVNLLREYSRLLLMAPRRVVPFRPDVKEEKYRDWPDQELGPRKRWAYHHGSCCPLHNRRCSRGFSPKKRRRVGQFEGGQIVDGTTAVFIMVAMTSRVFINIFRPHHLSAEDPSFIGKKQFDIEGRLRRDNSRRGTGMGDGSEILLAAVLQKLFGQPHGPGG